MKRRTLIFHTGNYNGPLQIIMYINSVDNWELVWPELIRQKNVVIDQPIFFLTLLAQNQNSRK